MMPPARPSPHIGINTARRNSLSPGWCPAWYERLREDNKAIFQAAGYVQRDADFLHGLPPTTNSKAPVQLLLNSSPRCEAGQGCEAVWG